MTIDKWRQQATSSIGLTAHLLYAAILSRGKRPKGAIRRRATLDRMAAIELPFAQPMEKRGSAEGNALPLGEHTLYRVKYNVLYFT